MPQDPSQLGLLAGVLSGAATDSESMSSLEGFIPGLELDDEAYVEEPVAEALTEVAMRIAGQYAEVLARFAGAALARKDLSFLIPQVQASVSSLKRLSEASGQTRQQALLDELLELTTELGSSKGRDYQRAQGRLREWIPSFAETLSEEDGQRLVALVTWDPGQHPLLDDLAAIRGIGPKRLASLYSAGLFSVEIVANAATAEVVAVTGLPVRLAEACIDAARSFADSERRRCVSEIRERSQRFRRILKGVSLDKDPELALLARDALTEMETTLRQLLAM